MLWGYSKWYLIKRKCPKHERRSIILSFEAEKFQPCDNDRRICVVCREASFNFKMFTNGVKKGLLPGAWVEKTVFRAFRKEGHADMKRLISIDCLENTATINCAFYCEILRRNSAYSLNNPRVSMYHRTNVLCCKERSLQKKKYSNSKVREENIAVIYYSAMIAASRKVHFRCVLLLPSSRWWRGVGESWLFDTRLTDRS